VERSNCLLLRAVGGLGGASLVALDRLGDSNFLAEFLEGVVSGDLFEFEGRVLVQELVD